MTILFLDDMATRAEIFLAWYPDAPWAKTADEAIALLARESFDLVCLDHDLDEAGYRGDLSPNSGMTVVDAIVAARQRFRTTVFVVHTLNDPAGREMTARLVAAGLHALRVPFGPELFRLLETAANAR